MDIILITQPKLKQSEAATICKLFDSGLERLHMRKPVHSALEVSCLLDAIPDHFHSNIVMHRHPELLGDYKLAGYHHSDGEQIQKCNGSISKSVHSLSGLADVDSRFDYLFYGPVYKSISKQGYRPKIPLPEVKQVLLSISQINNRPKVFALGGIRRKKVIPLSEIGFDGCALLGSVWGHSDPVKALKRFNQSCLKSLFSPL